MKNQSYRPGNFHDAQSLLDQLFAENPCLQQQIQDPSIGIFDLWPAVLKELELGILAHHSEIVQLEKGRLWLSVSHPVFVQELKLQQYRWLPKFEAALRQQKIADYRIRKVRFRTQ